MTAVSELELPALDYTNPALRGPAFHTAMRELREQGLLASMPLGYVALDRESGEFFLRSRSFTFPGMKIAEIFGIDEGPLWEEIRRNILHVNGEEHRRLRGLVNPFFTRRAVERWRPVMQATLAELFAPLDGRAEVVAALAKPYPSRVIATVMGAPIADAERLWEWSNTIQRQFGMTVAQERPQIEAALVEFYAWAEALLERRRGEPSDDLISALIQARFEGDRLDDAELVNLVLNVLVGGVDTTQSQLAQALRLFAEHPDQWATLAADPDLAPAAVEEVVRYEPITPFTARIALEDAEYRGVTFPAGTVVLVCAHTGNRDGETEGFDITVPRTGKPLTFGAGPHYCLGANLARAELQEALRLLAPRMPGLELDGEPAYGTIDGIYALDALPVRWVTPPATAASGPRT